MADGGLLNSPDFFDKEAGAPLLRRNAGYLQPGDFPPGLRERLNEWPALVGAVSPAEEVSVMLHPTLTLFT